MVLHGRCGLLFQFEAPLSQVVSFGPPTRLVQVVGQPVDLPGILFEVRRRKFPYCLSRAIPLQALPYVPSCPPGAIWPRPILSRFALERFHHSQATFPRHPVPQGFGGRACTILSSWKFPSISCVILDIAAFHSPGPPGPLHRTTHRKRRARGQQCLDRHRHDGEHEAFGRCRSGTSRSTRGRGFTWTAAGRAIPTGMPSVTPGSSETGARRRG